MYPPSARVAAVHAPGGAKAHPGRAYASTAGCRRRPFAEGHKRPKAHAVRISGTGAATCAIHALMTAPLFVALVLVCFTVCGCRQAGQGDREPSGAGSAAPPLLNSTPAMTSAPSSAEPEPRRRTPIPPRVTLSGRHNPMSVSVPGSPRVYANRLRAWIHARPHRDSQRLGYLRAGSSSPTSSRAAGHAGCRGGWYPVKPDGYVCVGRGATLDASDPVVQATQEHPPDFGRKLPYIYGTVRRPGPVYQRLPTAEQLRSAESDVDARIHRWLEAEGEIGASYAQHVWLGGAGSPPDPAQAWGTKRTDPLPQFLAGGAVTPNVTGAVRNKAAVVAGRTRARVGYSFLQTLLFEGRRYGVSAELEILPTDRLRPIQGSRSHGFEIGEGKDIQFPFAIVRRRGAKYWLLQKSSGRRIDAGRAPYFAAVKLTGKQRFFDQKLHYETVDGKWISDRDGSRLDPARRMPKWGKNGERWIDVNLSKQTAVLYNGKTAVYATLISSGEAGLEDPKHTSATRRGIFRIHTKHVTATMSSDELGEAFELRDVPYVQYFGETGGYALHGAYWHDRFGTPKSHGCLNLTPEDARRFFFWTYPQLPVGWHGVLLPLRGTILFVHP